MSDADARLPKEAMRKRLLSAVRQLPVPERLARSLIISAFLQGFGPLMQARRVAAFHALPGEVQLETLLSRLDEAGVSLYLPRVDGPGQLSFCPYRPGEALVEASLKVRQPPADAPAVADDGLDLLLVPGVGFDARGLRLGRGAAYYDRALPRFGSALRIGVCFACQRVEQLPTDAWDVPMDAVVTEEGLSLIPGGRLL